ncbi:MAG: glycoside hydrolase family 88 protein [Niameybacter sp.]|uniref:glycoside hydrolase family 88 protein n=1 Tax=Niameybacter sp. TaxID=2033640 RepID=UPI002FCAD32F
MEELWIDKTWNKIEHKLRQVAPRNQEKLPYTSVDGQFDDQSKNNVSWWTNGFWPGMMWLMYTATGDDLYKDTAIKGEERLDKALQNYDGLHHDVGFMWHITSGVHYRLLGDKQAKVRALYTANTLAGRYNLKGQFIRAWNGNGTEGWAIIDCMMNIPLLYWASRETKDERFRFIAESHADTTMENHVRPDGSVKHIIVYDAINGGVLKEKGGQGYGVGSSWSRGQAWALYGFVLSYIHTQKEEYLETAKRIAHYFIANISEDYLPKCDFRSPQEPVIYDSTAGAIAACGLIEIARMVPEYEKHVYLTPAVRMLKAMEEKFCNWDEAEDSILQMGTEKYHSDGGGRHIPIIYGDYFFVEALYKLKGNEQLFW